MAGLGLDDRYWTEPVNRYVGFEQVPQDQYVDNRTTSAGYPIIDDRTEAEIVRDKQIEEQGLYDASIDMLPVYGIAAKGIVGLERGLATKMLRKAVKALQGDMSKKDIAKQIALYNMYGGK